MSTAEHPFAEYVRILGRGKTGTRSLNFEEARRAFSMILSGQVEPLQLGAFLMLLRVKEESAEELAGFVSAARDSFCLTLPTADLDWSSYAGKRARQPWYLLAALLLADNGIRILMHGAGGHSSGRVYSEETLRDLGVQPAKSAAEVERQLSERHFSFLPLHKLCPALDGLLQLKPLLGLRSPVNTLVRMLNPARARYSLQSIFHPAYARLHAEADKILGQTHSLVFKGEGGEVEIKPNANTRCLLQRRGNIETLNWPRSMDKKPAPALILDAAELRRQWHRETDAYGTRALVETAACALLLMERCETVAAARDQAQNWWQARNRERFSCP